MFRMRSALSPMLASPLVLALACAPGPAGQMGTGMSATMSGPEVRVEETLPSVLAFPYSSVNDLWRVLPATFEALGIPGGVIDGANLVYGNEKVTETTVAGQSTRDMFRCAASSSLSGGQYRIQFGITAQPRPVPGGGAELFLQTAAFGRMVSGSRSGTTQCVSNGAIDVKIKEQMDIELARKGG
jgi:hypothetical protein